MGPRKTPVSRHTPIRLTNSCAGEMPARLRFGTQRSSFVCLCVPGGISVSSGLVGKQSAWRVGNITDGSLSDPNEARRRAEEAKRPLARGIDPIEAFSGVILAAVAAQKDISLVELAEMLRTEHGASFAASTVWRCLDRHSMTFKKTAHAAEQERSPLTIPSTYARGNLRSASRNVAARRRVWFAARPDLDPNRLVFIDETGASTKMARLRGRAHAPQGRHRHHGQHAPT